MCVYKEKNGWVKILPNLKCAAGLLHANGRPTVPSSLSPVVNIRSLIQSVQCQQFKRALSVFLSIPISEILLRVARSHFMAWAPSKATNVWRLLIGTAGMTHYFPTVCQCTVQIHTFSSTWMHPKIIFPCSLLNKVTAVEDVWLPEWNSCCHCGQALLDHLMPSN